MSEDSLQLGKILLWKTKVNEEIQNVLMMFFCPMERYIGTKAVTKPAIYGAVTFLKELKTGSQMYFASPLKTGGISLVAESDNSNVIVTEYGKVLDNKLAVENYIKGNKL